jgi:hypothetical protein
MDVSGAFYKCDQLLRLFRRDRFPDAVKNRRDFDTAGTCPPGKRICACGQRFEFESMRFSCHEKETLRGVPFVAKPR